MAAHSMGEIDIRASSILFQSLFVFLHPPPSFPLLCRIVNSELTYFMGALGSLENISAFRSSLFDVWTVNR